MKNIHGNSRTTHQERKTREKQEANLTKSYNDLIHMAGSTMGNGGQEWKLDRSQMTYRSLPNDLQTNLDMRRIQSSTNDVQKFF